MLDQLMNAGIADSANFFNASSDWKYILTTFQNLRYNYVKKFYRSCYISHWFSYFFIGFGPASITESVL